MSFKKALAFSLLTVCLMLAAQTVKATDVNIIFQDTTDAVSVSGPGSFVCALEGCAGTLGAPAPGATVVSTTLPLSVVPGTQGTQTSFVHLAEPGTAGLPCFGGGIGPCVSDGLHTVPVGGNVANNVIEFAGASSVSFIFMSDVDSIGLPSCTASINFGGCQFTENGSAMEVGTITWSDSNHTVDHIIIASDVEPEPTTLILFGSGLVMAGAFLRRHSRSV